MKTYKTLDGFFKAATKNKGYDMLRICDILNNNIFHDKNTYKPVKFELTGQAMEDFADLVSKYLYVGKSARLTIKDAIKNNCGDKEEYLQCFYLSKHKGKFYVSNSLSGEAFDYCKRKFYKTL